MSTPIEDLLLARASEMSAHDGAPMSTVYIVAAANQMQTDLLFARDRLLNPPATPIAADLIADADGQVAEKPVDEQPAPAKPTVKAGAAPIADEPAA